LADMTPFPGCGLLPLPAPAAAFYLPTVYFPDGSTVLRAKVLKHF
jgi:hypothetical protein